MAVEKEIEQLIKKFNNHFDGSPWYGDSLLGKLDLIDFQIVNNRSEIVSNSIAMLVKHIVNWRVYLIRKIENDIQYTIEINGPVDWPEIVISSEKEWIALLEELKQTQVLLIEILKERGIQFLKNKVPNKPFDFQYLIDGIIQHDVYHQGQIALAAKLY